MDRLSAVRAFWDETPCDGQDTYATRATFRYAKEPWLLPLLQDVASKHREILEVGCGQGTDAVTICRYLERGSQYTGVDMSAASIARAQAASAEMLVRLSVQPTFAVENAERLSFPDGRFACVLSVGALHHSENTEQAIAEVRRVLAPGGTAYVLLYRTLAPKLLGTHALRGVQRGLDAVLGTDRVLYRLARRIKLNEEGLGTMIYEGFGVPILRSYTRSGMQTLFKDFSSMRLTAYGVGLPPASWFSALDRLRSNPLGYLWLAEARK